MHHCFTKSAMQAAILVGSLLGTVVTGSAGGFIEEDLVANKSPLTDGNGISHTPAHVDDNLRNPWGLTASATSPFWISDNSARVSTLYDSAGVARTLVVAIHRLIQHGQLNSPWGVAVAPASFGALSNQLLIGNFGNGHINAYNPTTGEFVDKMRNPQGQAIVIDGLWSLRVGSNTASSANFGPNTVFFTAGPNGEQDGLFGAITSSP